MKKLIYTYILISLVFSSCQDDNMVPDNSMAGKIKFSGSVFMPELQMQTRAANIDYDLKDLWLLVFDAKGLFLERVHADELTMNNSSGSFTAQVTDKAGIIHAIANYDWTAFDDNSSLQKDERELLPSLYGNTMIFWGRSEITQPASSANFTLFRNQAKVTVESNVPNFVLTGYALCNYTTSGTVSPFIPERTPNPFLIEDDKPTLLPGSLSKTSQNTNDCTVEPKYMFENPNYSNDQCYLIIKGILDNGPELFYKIQFLDTNKRPYTIVRNILYRVVIEGFNQQAHGSTNFEDAMSSEPSNNIYAEIFKDSPSISDNNNNILTVSQLYFLFTKAGKLTIATHYTENGVAADSKINVSVAYDQANILSNLSYNGNGTITADIAAVIAGQNEASIEVKAGVLSRTITVTSTALYSFEPASISPNPYTEKEQEVALTFQIPTMIPSYLFPLKCEISTSNLYPIGSNKDMEIEFSNGTYKYIYWVYNPGENTLNFKTSAEDSDETITIENDYFHTANVPIQSRSFNNVSVNNNNIVNYGSGSTAVVRFDVYVPDNAPASYPFTVHIKTSNLTTNDVNWIAENGGYKRTYTAPVTGTQSVNFISNKDASAEDIVLSTDGFRNSTVYFDNVLTKNSPLLSNTIMVNSNGTAYYIPRYSVTSSNQNIVNSFTTNRNSYYSFQVEAGAKLSDTVTFRLYISSSQHYAGSLTVRELLNNPAIILK